jgi:hypothetical protein
MRYLTRALSAEMLKAKRTLALWLALIAPAVVIAVQVAMIWDRRAYFQQTEIARGAWMEYAAQTMVLWGLLMLPLFVTLETALVGQWEHASAGWKHLFALPVPRSTIYAAKQIASALLIGLSILVLTALIVLSGLSMRLWLPGLGFEAAVPLWAFAKYALMMFLGAWLVIAIQTWVAQRWSSFAVACGVGVAMTVAGVLVIQSDWASYYPWTLPVLVANGFSGEGMQSLNGFTDGLPWRELLLGTLGGLLFAVWGGRNVIRRDVVC